MVAGCQSGKMLRVVCDVVCDRLGLMVVLLVLVLFVCCYSVPHISMSLYEVHLDTAI